MVYLIHDEDNLYIGETTSAAVRMSQHLKNDEKKNLKGIEIIFDGRYNKSVILDYEQRLIKYCSVDGRFKKLLIRIKVSKLFTIIIKENNIVVNSEFYGRNCLTRILPKTL